MKTRSASSSGNVAVPTHSAPSPKYLRLSTFMLEAGQEFPNDLLCNIFLFMDIRTLHSLLSTSKNWNKVLKKSIMDLHELFIQNHPEQPIWRAQRDYKPAKGDPKKVTTSISINRNITNREDNANNVQVSTEESWKKYTKVAMQVPRRVAKRTIQTEPKYLVMRSLIAVSNQIFIIETENLVQWILIPSNGDVWTVSSSTISVDIRRGVMKPHR